MLQIPVLFKRLLLLIFAVVTGIAAVSMTSRYIRQRELALQQEREQLLANYPEPIEVVVAAKDLPVGTALDASHLKMAKMPQVFTQPYSVRNPGELLGMVTGAPIAEDEQVLLNKLHRAGQEPARRVATLSGVTPEGLRAVTIVADQVTGVGGFIRSQDHVDVLWTVSLPAEGQQGGAPVTMTLFQDVPVLAINTEAEGVAASARPQQASVPSQSQQQGGFTATLALPPQDTSLLLFAREHGRIQLSLRPKNEAGQVAVAPANLNTIMERVLGPAAMEQQAKPVKGSRQVEVYKGLKRDVIALNESE